MQANVSQCAVSSLSVVEDFDIVKQAGWPDGDFGISLGEPTPF